MNSDIILCLVVWGMFFLAFLLIKLFLWLDSVNDVLHFYEFYKEELEDLVFKRRCKK